MKKTTIFRKGEVYFSVGFFDPELTLPMIETYVYVGIENDEFLFIDVTGHMLEPGGEMPESAHYLALQKNNKSSMLDRESLIEWLAVEHTSKRPAPFEYEYSAV